MTLSDSVFSGSDIDTILSQRHRLVQIGPKIQHSSASCVTREKGYLAQVAPVRLPSGADQAENVDVATFSAARLGLMEK